MSKVNEIITQRIVNDDGSLTEIRTKVLKVSHRPQAPAPAPAPAPVATAGDETTDHA